MLPPCSTVSGGLIATVQAQGSPLALVADIRGRVEIVRGGKARAAKNGDKLYSGDRLRTAKSGGKATIFALGGSPRKLSAGQEVAIAAPSGATGGSIWRAVYAGVSTGLGARNAGVPASMRDKYLELWAPVDSKILEGRPHFVWTKGSLLPADIAGYQITIRTTAATVHTAAVDGTQYDYPATAPALKPGERYFWRLVPKLRSGELKTEWASSESWFQPATPAEAGALRTDLNTLAGLKDLDAPTRTIATAALYSERGFNFAALKTLVDIQNPDSFAARAAVLPESGQAMLRSLLASTKQVERLAQLSGVTRDALPTDTELNFVVPEANPAEVPAGALKTYVDPTGDFSLAIPVSWGALRMADEHGFSLTSFGAQFNGTPAVSVAVAKKAALGNQTLTEWLVTVGKASNTITVEAGAPDTFAGLPATRTAYTWKNENFDARGFIWEFTQGDKAYLVAVGNDPAKQGADFDGPFALTQKLANGIRTVGVTAPPAKPEVPFAEQQKAINEESARVLEIAKNLNQVTADTQSEDPAAALSLTDARAAFQKSDAARAATKPNTLERARAARNTANYASHLAWATWSAGRRDESKLFFDRHAALETEYLANRRAYFEKEYAQTQTRIAEIKDETPHIVMAGMAHVVLNGWMDVQNNRLNLLQKIASSQGDTNAQLRYARAALDIRRKQYENMTLSTYGEKFRTEARMQIAAALENLGDAYEERAAFDKARVLYRQALATREGLPGDYIDRQLNIPLRNLAVVAYKSGDLVQSREWYEKALAEMDAADPGYRKAAEAVEEPLRSLRLIVNIQSRATLLNNLGIVVQAQGDYRTAEEIFNKSLALSDTIPVIKEASWVKDSHRAKTLGNLAVLKADSGQPEEALRYLSESMDLHRSLGDVYGLAVAMLNRSGLLYNEDNVREARSYAEQAHKLFLSTQQPSYASSTAAFLARLELRNGRFDAADKFAAESLQLAQSAGDTDSQTTAELALTRIALDRARNAPNTPAGKKIRKAQLDRASTYIRRVELKTVRSGSPLGMVTFLSLRGQIKTLAGDTKGAIEDYKSAIARLESIRATTASQDAFSEQQSNFAIYQRLVELLLQQGRSEEAFDYLSRARSKKMQNDLRLSNVKTQDPVLNKLLQRVTELEKKLSTLRAQLASENAKSDADRDKTKIANLRDLVASTQADFFQVSNELKEKNPAFDKILTVKPRELKKAQRSIPGDAVLVQYAPLQDGLYIFVVTRDDLKIYAPKVSSSELWRKVRQFRTLMDGAREKVAHGEALGTPETDPALKESITGLYDMLLAPVEGDLQGKKTVAFIPTGLLYYVPLHALAKDTPKGLQYFIEQKQVAYLAAADVLSVVQTRDEANYGSGLLALGDPTGANLPEAREEVQEIARIFPASQALTGENATKAVLMDSKNLNKRVLHLATHGVLNSASPTDSYIQLSGNAEQGRLDLGEVYGLNLNRVDLVTLSACQTAIGEKEPDGGEITSLAEAFSSAGTPTVIASLWSVEDASTRALMEEFYRSFANGDSKALSLQKAQISLLKDPKTRHPFYWAPFEILGDWR